MYVRVTDFFKKENNPNNLYLSVWVTNSDFLNPSKKTRPSFSVIIFFLISEYSYKLVIKNCQKFLVRNGMSQRNTTLDKL